MALRRRYIQKNSCKHTDCPNMPQIGFGGYCWKHEKEDPAYERKKAKAEAKKIEPKLRGLVAVDDKLVDNTAAMEFQLLQNWFSDGARELSLNPKCAECGEWIPPKYYRASTAHILPKRKIYGFPSVQSLPANRMYIGAKCGCHSKFDQGWESAQKMKVWNEIVIPMFAVIHPFIHPSEMKNLPPILREQIPIPVDTT